MFPATTIAHFDKVLGKGIAARWPFEHFLPAPYNNSPKKAFRICPGISGTRLHRRTVNDSAYE